MQKEFYQFLFANETLYQIEQAPIISLGQTPQTDTLPSVVSVVVPEHQSALTVSVPTNAKQPAVLIVVAAINIAERALLDKILKAIHLEIDTVDLLILNEIPDMDIKTVLSDKKVHHFITFGVPLQQLKMDILLAPYQTKVVAGVNFLYSDALGLIENDKAKKLMLWNTLKKQFGS
jgi:DNA polymerase III psi subunit